MASFMVLGNHRGSIEFYGLFHSQIEAINTIDLARCNDRDQDNPLVWKLVDNPNNEFCNRFSVQAYDGTCTTNWIVFEVVEPARSLDVMINDLSSNVVKVEKTASEAWDDYFKDRMDLRYVTNDEPIEHDGF